MSKKSTEENVGQSGTDAKIEAGTDDASVDRLARCASVLGRLVEVRLGFAQLRGTWSTDRIDELRR